MFSLSFVGNTLPPIFYNLILVLYRTTTLTLLSFGVLSYLVQAMPVGVVQFHGILYDFRSCLSMVQSEVETNTKRRVNA